MKIVCVRIPDSHAELLEQLAEIDERSVSDIIRRAIRQYLETSRHTA